MSRRTRAIVGLVACVVGTALAIGYGAKASPWPDVLAALLTPDPRREIDEVLWAVRLPRVLAGALVGAALAVAGGVLQALTRNPLAGPELTGFNSGASLAVLVGMLLLPGLDLSAALLFSFGGGLVGMTVVLALCAAGRGGVTPTRLALAGLVVSSTLAAVSSGLINYFQLGFESLYWTMGGLNTVLWSHLALVAGVMAVGFVLTVTLAASLDALRLGAELATGLGLATRSVQIRALVAATLLAGAAVAIAGPVAFVGLMSPHVARAITGGSYVRVLPLSAAIGALAVVWADALARVHGGGYIPLGVFVSCIGALGFLVLVGRAREVGHV